MYFSSSFILAALPLLATAAPGFQLPFAAKIGDALNTATTTRPGSGDVIDLTKYTIGQILNYTLSQHHREHHGDGDHDHDHEHEELARALEDHGHPHHPPLVKLAWIVNRTEAVSHRPLSLLSIPLLTLRPCPSDQGVPLRSRYLSCKPPQYYPTLAKVQVSPVVFLLDPLRS